MTGRTLPGAVAGRFAALAEALSQGPRAHVANFVELGPEVIAAEQEDFGGRCGIRHGVSYLTVYYAVRNGKSNPRINDPAVFVT
jgi:hypothetical protein